MVRASRFLLLERRSLIQRLTTTAVHLQPRGSYLREGFIALPLRWMAIYLGLIRRPLHQLIFLVISLIVCVSFRPILFPTSPRLCGSGH